MTDYAVVLLYPPGYEVVRAFADVAESVHWALIASGHNSVTSHVPVTGRQNIVFGANNIEIVDFELEPNSIIYNLEWIADPNAWWINEAFISAHKKYRVWDFCTHNVHEFKRFGITVEDILPIGYVPQLTKVNHVEPEIDVLFVGSKNERRSKILNDLHNKGLRVCQLSNVYGHDRDSIIGRSKVVLNMQSMQPKIFEMVRVSYYLANRCAVVSEKSCNHSEYLEYEDAINFCSYNEMVDQTLELCFNSEKRLNLADKGFEVFRQHKLVDYLKKLI